MYYILKTIEVNNFFQLIIFFHFVTNTFTITILVSIDLCNVTFLICHILYYIIRLTNKRIMNNSNF